jgi:hypothetical protein
MHRNGLEIEGVMVGHQDHAVLGGKGLLCKLYARQVEAVLPHSGEAGYMPVGIAQ